MQKKKKKENKNKKTIITIVAVVVIALVVWLLVSPLIRFNENKEKMVDGAENYMDRNSVMLPEEGSVRTIKLSTLYSQKYVDTLYSPIGGDLCSVEDSWVKVTNVNGEYHYYPYLKCGIFETKSVDHTGPVITLNGKEEITINVGDKYKDEGVKSVNDNEDGVMDASKVEIKNNVKTSKAGTYKVTYKISDSLGNETVKVRTVHVIKKLSEVVKDDTNNTGVYKGNVDNNYMMFSGMLFRIVKVNDDDTIRIMADDIISYVDYNNVDSWLNGYFYDHLSDGSKKYIVKGKFCDDVVNSSPSKVTKCNKYKDANVGLISVDEFNKSIDDKSNSYLYEGAITWIGNSKNSKKAWTIKGGYTSYSSSYSNAIHPVVNLVKDVEIKSGDGSVENPYTIGDYKSLRKSTKVNNNGSSKIIMYSVLKDDYKNVVLGYEKNRNRVYNPEENGNLGYKINQKLGDYIRTTDFVKFEVDVPIYKNSAAYNHAQSTKKYNVKLAAPKMSEMFSGSYEGDTYWFRDSSNHKTRIYITSNNSSVYNSSNYLTDDTAVKLVASLNKNMIIIDGKGTKEEPYKVTK